MHVHMFRWTIQYLQRIPYPATLVLLISIASSCAKLLLKKWKTLVAMLMGRWCTTQPSNFIVTANQSLSWVGFYLISGASPNWNSTIFKKHGNLWLWKLIVVFSQAKCMHSTAEQFIMGKHWVKHKRNMGVFAK